MNQTAPQIQSIIITSDLLRSTSGLPYAGNKMITKSKLFFARAIELATGLPVEVIYGQDTTRFDRDKFYSLSGYSTANMQSWLSITAGAYSGESLAYFASCFSNCLMIVQEAGALKPLMDQLNIPYVEHCISSIRFLEDLHYAFRSNVASVREKLLHYQVGEYALHANADRVRLYYLQEPRAFEIKPGSLLLCGQREVDFSLVKEGRIVSFLDYKNELEELLGTYRNVYYKRHPQATFENDSDQFICAHKNVRQIKINFYKLMSDAHITGVAALSSGTLNEAPYFGKQVFTISHCFAQHYTGSGVPQPEAWITLKSEYFSAAFWADILQSILPVQNTEVTCHFSGDVVRRTTKNNWDYEIGMEAIAGASRLQVQYEKLEEKYKELDAACYHLGVTERAFGQDSPSLKHRLGIAMEISMLRMHCRLLLRPFLPALVRLFKYLFPRETKRNDFFRNRLPAHLQDEKYYANK